MGVSLLSMAIWTANYDVLGNLELDSCRGLVYVYVSGDSGVCVVM